MKKRSWVVTLVSLITIVGLLLTATPAYAAGPPPEQPGSAKQFRDANKNKIFDNLETRMAPAGMQQPFGVIVQFNKPLGEIDFPALKHQGGPFSVKYEYPSVNAISTTFTKGQIIAAAKHDLVKQIEYNGEVHAFLDTATLSFGVQKARTDFRVDGDADDNSTSYSAADLVIAVLDTGINAAHVDLAGGKVIGWPGGKVIGWKDFVGNETVPYDDHGHGTHVASIAAGTGEASEANGRSYTGVAPGAALVVVKTLDSSASGTWEDANAGIRWVIENKVKYGIDVMNISWGASGSSDGSSVTEQLVNQAVVDKGIVVAVAAGNAGPETYTIGVPAAAAEAITVGAMADVGEGGFFQALFSSRGPTADGRIKPDISSPGWNVMAAKHNSTIEYTEMSGTSMATPFLAGVAALMLDAKPTLQPNDVKTKFMDTAVDWGPSGPDVDYGAGRLDAYEAIKPAPSESFTGPTAPNHEYVTDSLHGKNKVDWWDINISRTDYPIAITMIMPDWTSWRHPDFDMQLYNPNGELVAWSSFIERQETIAYQPSVTGTYKLKVWSYAGSGDYFFDLSAGMEAPAAPAGLVATAGDGLVSLDWGDNTEPDLAGYNVKRATGSGGPYTQIAAGVTASAYTDSTVTNGTTYYYVVTAVDAAGNESANSTQASATPQAPDTTPPAAPAGLVATAGDGLVSLDWGDNTEPDLAGYNVKRATGSGGPYTQIAAGVTASAHTDSTVTNGTTYYYVVTAVDTSGNESGTSNEASATPESTPGVSVTSITPNSVVAGGSVPVTITGSGFESGASVTLEGGEGPTPKVSNVVVVDSNTIRATISTKSGGPPRNRYWDVRVTNLDTSTGVLENENGFVVEPK